MPEYKWNQWFFLKLYEQGLAYCKKSRVNGSDGTCSRHEQVVDGCFGAMKKAGGNAALEQWSSYTNYSENFCRSR